MQGLSSCDKASSSMYLREVMSNKLTHLYEEVTYVSFMHWDDSPYFAQRCYYNSGKGGGNAGVVMAWHGSQGCTCRIFVADWS